MCSEGAANSRAHRGPEGIPDEPASCENPVIVKKRFAGAVAQPLLTTADSDGFGAPCPVSLGAVIPVPPSDDTKYH